LVCIVARNGYEGVCTRHDVCGAHCISRSAAGGGAAIVVAVGGAAIVVAVGGAAIVVAVGAVVAVAAAAAVVVVVVVIVAVGSVLARGTSYQAGSEDEE